MHIWKSGKIKSAAPATLGLHVGESGLFPSPPDFPRFTIKTKVSCERQNVKKKWHHFFEIQCLPYTGPL